MAKEVAALIKLQIKGGQANPAPPVGPALGAKGVNIMEFCKQYNARTQDKPGKVLPCVITVYSDKSFDFVIKSAVRIIQECCHGIQWLTSVKKGAIWWLSHRERHGIEQIRLKAMMTPAMLGID